MVVPQDPRFNASFRPDLQVPKNSVFDACRYQLTGPIWPKNEIQTILKCFPPGVVAWTEECNNDVISMFDDPILDLAKHVDEAVTSGVFQNSQWCEQNPGGPAAPCDSYLLQRPKLPRDLYIKFAIMKNGMKILVSSCHVSKYPRKVK